MPPKVAHADPECKKVLLMFVRGSGAPLDPLSNEAATFFSSVNGALGISPVTSNVVQLGDEDGDGGRFGGSQPNGVGIEGVDAGEYPAVIGAQWVAFPGYDGSVTIGVDEYVNYMNQRVVECPEEAEVAAGFSQGADLLGRALRRDGSDGRVVLTPLARARLAYVALYGDPTYNNGGLMYCAYPQYTPPVPWQRGSAKCNLLNIPLAQRDPYVPADFRHKTGSWCDEGDNLCSHRGFEPGTHTYIYAAPGGWIEQSAAEIAGRVWLKIAELNPSNPPLIHSTAPDGVIIQSTDNNLYVAAGGRLFWFDQNNARMLAAFRAQMQAKYGTTSYPLMVASEVHAVEVNRTSTGAYSPGSNMPADNTFMYEYGTTQQYVVKFEHPFAIGDTNEVIALGGQDRAVMVPPGLADLQTHPAQWVQNDLLLFGTDPSVWHYAGSQGFRVPGVPTRDCLQVRWNRGVTYMPASAWNYFPTHPTQQAACDFTHGQWLYGTPSNRQVEVLYGTGHAVQYGEVAGLGGTNQARPVSDFTIDWLMGNAFNPPEHHMFRAANSPTVYLTKNGQKHLVGSPATRDCLGVQYGVGVEVVPQSFLNNLPTGDGAQCAYEGKQLLGAGGAVDYVQGGLRHHVQNPAIRDCLIGRAGTGQPVAVDATTWNAYGQGNDAYCPYEQEPGLNFVYDPATPGIVWLVGPATGGTPGVKRHAGSFCVPDPYTTPIKAAHVFTVPAGETAGHTQGADWWPSGADCQALPG